MHIIPFSTYIHFNSFPLGCGISHAHTQNSFCIIKIHVGSVGQQQPIAPTWSRKGGNFSGLTEGTRMPQVAQLYRTIAGVCYPRALSTPNRLKTSRPCRRHVDKSTHLLKTTFCFKNPTRVLITLFKTSKIAYSS